MECTAWPPPRRGKRVFLLVPSSILSTEPTLELKTLKASEIARAAAIYRVDTVFVYKDRRSNRREYQLLRLLLRYAVTPPHLKRLVFPLDPRLRYAGLMRPLQTPAHNPPETLEEGAVLDVYVEQCRGGQCTVNMGRLGRGLLKVEGARNPLPGEIITARLVAAHRDRPVLERFDPPYYWNLRVRSGHPVRVLLEELRRAGILVVGTSRLGECLEERSAERIRAAGSVILVFGGPEGHVWDSVPRDLFDLILNTIPLQGTRTVRTEEAVLATLARLDPLLG